MNDSLLSPKEKLFYGFLQSLWLDAHLASSNCKVWQTPQLMLLRKHIDFDSKTSIFEEVKQLAELERDLGQLPNEINNLFNEWMLKQL